MVLRKYHPEIIAVTGSVGKTSAKDAIFEVVSQLGRTRKSQKSYNSEIGIPLTILGRENAWGSFLGWFGNIAAGFKIIFFKTQYPEILILEVGADRPGDIARSIRLIKPHIAVVTTIGEIPVHVEFFAGPKEVAQEKSKLLKHLSASDFAILNADDDSVFDMKKKTNAHVITYGFGEGALIRPEHYHIMYREENGGSIPEGIAFKVDYAGKNLPVRIFGAFGKQQVYAALAAIAVGIAKEMNLFDIISALSRYSSPPGRLKLINGQKRTWILDDTYNASPHAMHAALEVLRDIPAKRKIAVLGDMLELGKFTESAHRAVAERLEGVDILFAVGARAKFIADEARSRGFAEGAIFECDTSYEAAKKLEPIIEQGDLILVKGSQSMRMERVVEAVMAHPDEAEKLLVRQEKIWKEKA